MRSNKMTGRERVGRMFRRESHDSIPRSDSFWSETIDRFRAEGMVGEIHDYLGNDFVGLCWSDPKPYPNQNEVVAEDEQTTTTKDAWGNLVRYWKHRSGTPEHVGFSCVDADIWRSEFKPALLAAGCSVDIEGAKRSCSIGRRNGRWCHLTGLESFEMTRRLMGDEITLMGMIEDPDWVVDVSRTMTDLVLADWNVLEASGTEFDGCWVYGDMAYRGGTMCSPAMYEELFWPDHKRLADWAHQRGVPFIYHTDGDVNGVIDLYLKAGFDCLQPLEVKANMDVRNLAPKYGDRLALFGNIDVMAMSTNDKEIIEHEIKSKLAATMQTQGYAYHSDHSVPPAVSWETYQFIVELIDRYGNYD